jgi:hypothetical protein
MNGLQQQSRLLKEFQALFNIPLIGRNGLVPPESHIEGDNRMNRAGNLYLSARLSTGNTRSPS